MASTRPPGSVMAAPQSKVLLSLLLSSIFLSTASPSHLQPICPASAAENAHHHHHLRSTSFPHHTTFFPNTPVIITEEPFQSSIFNGNQLPTANHINTARASASPIHPPLPHLSPLSSINFQYFSASGNAASDYSSPSTYLCDAQRKLPAKAARTSRTPRFFLPLCRLIIRLRLSSLLFPPSPRCLNFVNMALETSSIFLNSVSTSPTNS